MRVGIILFLLTCSSAAFAQSGPDIVERAVDDATAAAIPPDVAEAEDAEDAEAEDERSAEPAAEADDFEVYLRRQASLEVQIGLRLFQEFDDYRAITALKRYRILDPRPEADFLSSLMIGQIYHRNEKPQLAVIEFEQATKAAQDETTQAFAYLLALQEMCVALHFYAQCQSRLQELGQAPLPKDVRELIDYQVLYNDVVLRSPYVSKKRAELIREPLLRSKALELVQRDSDFHDISLKSPVLAGVLSGVLPGAGQAYNGQWLDAAASLIVNSAMGGLLYYSIAVAESIPGAVVSGVFALGFYTGNIVNAVSDAQRINADRYLSFFEDLKRDLWPRVQFEIEDGSPQFGYGFDWPGPTLESKTREALERAEDGAAAEEAEPPAGSD